MKKLMFFWQKANYMYNNQQGHIFLKVTNSRHSDPSSVYADVYLRIAICISVIFNLHVLLMENHHKMAAYLTAERDVVKTSGTLK